MQHTILHSFPDLFFLLQLSKTKQIIIQQHVQDKEKGLEKTSLHKHNKLTNALD